MRRSCRRPRGWPRTLPALALGAIAAACGGGYAGSFAGASHVPDSQAGWERWQTAPDPAAPLDEAKGGRTARGALAYFLPVIEELRLDPPGSPASRRSAVEARRRAVSGSPQ